MFGAWNVRGLNDPVKAREVRRMCVEQQIQLMGFLETRVRRTNARKVQQSLLSNWQFTTADTQSSTDRI